MSTLAASNGAAVGPPIRQSPPRGGQPPRLVDEPIAYVRGDHSPLLFGTLNAATALLSEIGVTQRIALLYRFITEARAARTHEPIPLYRLRCEAMIEQAGARLAATSPLGTHVGSVEEFEARRRQFEELLAGLPSPHRQEIEQAARSVVSDCFRSIVSAIDHAADRDLLGLGSSLHAVEAHLDRVVCPAPTGDGALRLARMNSFIATLRSPGGVPEPKRDQLRHQVLAQSQQACVLILKDLVAVEVANCIDQEILHLRAHCREVATTAKAAQQHVEGAQQLLDEQVVQANRRWASAAVEGLIGLEGLSSDECMKQLKEACGGSYELLVEKLLAAYDDALQKRHAAQLGDQAGGGRAMAVASAEEGVAVFRDLIFERLSGQSIYAAIAKYGVEPLVRELIRLSEPMVHLDRSNVVNNIEPAYRTTLVLPPAADGDDTLVLEALRAEAQRQISARGSDAIAVQERDDAGQACHLTQTLTGYSAATLADNRALAWAYCRSRELNHPAQLFGILPDCPDGQASEIVVELIRCLENPSEGEIDETR